MEDDKAIEKELFIQRVYGVIMLEINTHNFIEEILSWWNTNMKI